MKKLIVPILLCLAGCQSSGKQVHVLDLHTNYETVPLTVETPQPQFSWRMETDTGTGVQQAYELSVLNEAGQSVWDSGKVMGQTSVGVTYAGPELEPTSHYDWRVKIWCDNGETAQAQSFFETGFMQAEQSAWAGAEWIGGSEHDRVFRADYLSVFKLSVDVQLQPGSQRAAFLLGGNDYRLQNKYLNIRQIESGKDESFVALELDVSGLDRTDGQANLNIYRVGYAAGDSKHRPFASLAIPRAIVNENNRYAPHRILLDSEFGIFTLYIDERSQPNRITPIDPALPFYVTQGLNVNPAGRGNDYISYPMLGNIGFWLKPKQQAVFSNIEVHHFRSPSNVLFAAGSANTRHYPEIFLNNSSDGISQQENGGYLVAAQVNDLIRLADPSRDGNPMLRREFTLTDKPIKKARLYVTARGVYEVYLNGQRVGTDYFTPGLTQYNKHHTYQAYDVTGLLNPGSANALGALLSEGWWSGNITFTGSNWNFFGDQQSLLAKLVVTFNDGSERILVSEPGGWKVFHGGPIRYGSFFQGEIYDAKRESQVAGWLAPGYDDSRWQPARVVPLQGSVFIGDPARDNNNQLITSYDQMRLTGHPGASPQIVKTLQAVAVEEVRPGVYVYDMGQNMVGFPRIQLGDTATDQRVLLRYAEVRYPKLPEHESLDGMIMMENIRAALVNEIYYPKGQDDVIQPRFTFHGYRYLEITGIKHPLPLEAVEGLVVSSVNPLTAHYETSNPLVNKLWENITWSMRGNFLSIPTDTPARNERMGWSGDLNVFASTASYMANINPFIKRHLMALRDIQSKEGRFSDVAPLGGGIGGTLWGSVGIIVPWETYQQYGDITLLRDHYTAMVRYIDFLQSKIDPTTGVLIEGPLGDWLSPESGKNDNSLLWEAYQVHLLSIMQKVAGLLGETADSERFSQLHAERKTFFNKTYVDTETGKTISSSVQAEFGKPIKTDSSLARRIIDTQASYAIPIAMDVFDEKNMPLAKQHLAAAVARQNIDDSGTVRPEYSLMTGFIGTASLTEALSLAGRDDQAYRLLQQTSYPSWLYSVVNDATTIWERLNSYTKESGFGGNNSMNSFNHYSFGAVGNWMMERSLGIRGSVDSAGFQHFVLAPTPDPTGAMTWAKGYYDSQYGRIESGWSVTDGQTEYQLVVPENTTATLHLPAGAQDQVQASNPVGEYAQQDGQRIYQLAPGRYSITVVPSN